MTEHNEHIRTLMAARDTEIARRRKAAKALTNANLEGGHVDSARATLIQTQITIEAIDRAINDEKVLAGPAIPS